jgi:Mrp family chromosome partitioning ATPase
VSLETVRTHVKHVYTKCGARDRAQSSPPTRAASRKPPFRVDDGSGEGVVESYGALSLRGVAFRGQAMALRAHMSGTNSVVPRLPEPVLLRPRLPARLADGARRHVALISEPPGVGRTTLLAFLVAAIRQLEVDGERPLLILDDFHNLASPEPLATVGPPVDRTLAVLDLNPSGARTAR